jgi:hypothetical protein
MILPQQYDSTPALELLREAELARVSFDQRLIRSLIARPEETIPALVRFAAEIHEDRLLDLEDQVFDLFRHFRTPEAIPFYISLLRRDFTEVPDELVEAFAEIGAPALDPLLKLREELGDEEGADLTFVLAAVGVVDPRVDRLLEETLVEDPYEGALCIGLYGNRELAPAVSRALALLPEDASQERSALQSCLEGLATPPDRTLAPPQDWMDAYPAESTPLFDILPAEQVLEALTAEDPRWREGAARSFCGDDYSDAIRAALVRQAGHDSEPAVRAACLRALGGRVEEPEVRALLEAVLTDTRQPLDARSGALVGLSAHADNEAFRSHVLSMYEAEETRAAAIEAMWSSGDIRYSKYFALNLRSQNAEVRRQAVQGVGAYRLEDLALELVPLFQDEEVRKDALFAYALAVRASVTPKSVHRLVEMIEEKADGLSNSETQAVCIALDRRLEREGFRPVFFPDEDEEEYDHEHEAPVEVARSVKVGRNDPCPCGSGKKFKKCCGA